MTDERRGIWTRKAEVGVAAVRSELSTRDTVVQPQG
jgi:hypothetical protein